MIENRVCIWRISLLFIPVVFTSEPFDPFVQNAIQRKEGEQQYLTLKNNANLPQYGECWTQAISQLDATCAHLTENTQAALAWRFTKCFMDQTMDSQIDLCDLEDKQCLANVPERIFQAYTNFFTHTQSICFYLMSQLWHTETEHTINALRTHSQSVSKQLEMAGRLQVNLLQQQREGLKVQRQLVEHGLNLSEVLHESRGRLARLTAEFRNSTIEHGRQLGDLFRRISMLHNWFIGEYAFIEQIIYFLSQLFVILLMTAAKRTENSRFILFLVSGIQILIECVWHKIRESDSFDDDSQVKQLAYVWIFRKIFIALIVMIYVTMATVYVDAQQLTVQLLKTIQQQNNELLHILRTNERRKCNGLNAAVGVPNWNAEEILNESQQNILNRDTELKLNSNDILSDTNGMLEKMRNLECEMTKDLKVGVRLRSRRATANFN